jgi:iron(III) transport system permease protein
MVMPWRFRAAALALAVTLCAPLFFLAWQPGQVDPILWAHVREVLLPRALAETAVLLAGVGITTLTLGLGFAWLVTRYRFPGQRFFDWALALPLALPAYVLAYVGVVVFSFDAPMARAWRDVGLDAGTFPELRSVPGAILVLSLSLFPYIYLLMRASLKRHGSAAFDAARTLGASPRSAFFRVVLPVTKAAWLGGLGLVLLETLADFGAVRLLGLDTLTPLILHSWTALGSLALAAQLSVAMLGVVVIVLALGALRAQRVAPIGPELRTATPQHLSPFAGFMATLACVSVFALGFLLPVLHLLVWAWSAPVASMASMFDGLRGTLVIAALTACFAVLIGLFLAALRKRYPSDRVAGMAVFTAGLGYAVPGAVMAVAVLWALTAAQGLLQSMGIALAISTSLFAVILALLMRFQRVGLSAAEAALSALRPSLMQSAATLGLGPWARWRRVALPVLRPGLLAALLLVFVEAMKELPATLMLRPFGWDTLAVQVYSWTSEGLWAQAALPALLLCVVGLLPVALLLREREQEPRSRS